MTTVQYAHWKSGIRGVRDRLLALIDEHALIDVCDVGGGANPTLKLADVEHRGLRYTVLDISRAELDKASPGFATVCADISDAEAVAPLRGRFDLVFSNTLAEHVARPEPFHRNVYDMLRSGGFAAHFMPTMYDPMFIANRLLPEGVSRRLVSKAQPDRRLDTTEGKFPAYYRWCRGPSEKHLGRFRAVGFDVEVAVGYFGTGYLSRTPLHQPYEAITRRLVEHPVDALVSYTWLVLRKPPSA